MRWTALRIALASVLALPCSAQPDHGFDWVIIGDAGNRPYDREDPFPERTLGRGGVDYVFRITRSEITTGQWLEYVNTFSTQSDDLAFFSVPLNWGAEIDPEYDGPGARWRPIDNSPSMGMIALGGVSWHWAARYANWLHNGRQADLASLETGAYDTSTWGYDGRNFTDDLTHLPGARYWIPTLDEHLKAGYYDPAADHWWLSPNGTDDPIPFDQTSAGKREVGDDPWLKFPLGSYPDAASPYGLLDLSGGAAEWLEETFWPDNPEERWLKGSWITTPDGYWNLDYSYETGSAKPDSRIPYASFRIATPAPSTVVVLALFAFATRRRTRNEPDVVGVRLCACTFGHHDCPCRCR